MGKPKMTIVEEAAQCATSDSDADYRKKYLEEHRLAIIDCHECAALAVQALSRSLARHSHYNLKLDLVASGHEGLMRFVATELKEAAEFFDIYIGCAEGIEVQRAARFQPQN
jgi:hypothetical protein